MDDAKFEQELDRYVEQLITENHVVEKNGNMDDLRKTIKELVVNEIDIEILGRLSKEKAEEIDRMMEDKTLTDDKLKELIQEEGIDYEDAARVATERFSAAFSKMVKEKGLAKNE